MSRLASRPEPVTNKRKKQAVALGILLALAALAWGRLMMTGTPRAASGEALSAPVIGSEPSPPAAREPRQATVRVSRADELTRDLFVFDDASYARRPSTQPVEQVEPVITPQQRVARMLEENPLELQGTVLGDRPRALINGKVYNQGGAVHGFTLKQVDDRRAVIEREGVEVRLEMK